MFIKTVFKTTFGLPNVLKITFSALNHVNNIRGFIFANNFRNDGEKVQGVYLAGRSFSFSNNISKLNCPGKSEVSITVGKGGVFVLQVCRQRRMAPERICHNLWSSLARACTDIVL